MNKEINPYIKVTWEDTPENFTQEKLARIKTYFKKKYRLLQEDFPIATEYSNSVISLPLYPALLDKEIEYIIYQIKEIWMQFHS